MLGRIFMGLTGTQQWLNYMYQQKTLEGKELNAVNVCTIIWASTQENLSSVVANNKGTDQPAHPRRLISACSFAGEISIV